MCTRILWTTEGQPVLVARNMDWTERMGTKLYAMPRGIERQGMTSTNPMKWTSKYGSVVGAIWNSASADGMNEAGLVANLLYLAESNYGERDAALAGLSVSVWAQYYLDNFATVAEAVEATKTVQVVPFGLTHKGEAVDAPIHISLADATGDSAVIEILDGKPVIHHGKQFTVMTNSPPYDEQLILLKQYEGLGGNKPLPGTADADDRFVRSAYYLTKLPEQPTTYQEAVAGVLTVIRNAATPIGANDPVKPNVSATQWRTISDLTNKRYFFEFTNMPNVVWIDLDKLSLNEGAPVQAFDLAADLEASGQISDKFSDVKPFEFQTGGTVVTWKLKK
ncbi:MAG: linear amide C-N hydrolase [Desulfuromonadales bacterium]|nr:linear amide C-N hydrolase [Desulfuromonadales bacterium]MDH4025405.1 linear amide C-N hydrolase [Desulfuromonadales bacterium]